MKIYQTKKTQGENATIQLIATPDPKRKGMYKITEIQERNERIYKGEVIQKKETLKFSYLYGKCNQTKILALIKTMTEA